MVPLHSHKLTATLQHVLVEDAESPQRNPLITRVEVRAGHGAGKPTEKIIAGAGSQSVVTDQVEGTLCSMRSSAFCQDQSGAEPATCNVLRLSPDSSSITQIRC